MDKAETILMNRISESMQTLDSLVQESSHAMETIVDGKKHLFMLSAQKLEALNPLSVIARGIRLPRRAMAYPL